MNCSRFRSVRLLLILLLTATGNTVASAADYRLTDPALKLTTIDSDPHESFLGLAIDPEGRLFAGSREALFVYEPASKGLYLPRRELYRFPKNTWTYDIAVRGHDLYVLTAGALYVFHDGAVKREGLEPERLLWGMPLAHIHQGLHGMAFGPDGDLYLSQGDQLWYYGDFQRRPDHWGHWTLFHGPANAATTYTGSGGVLRLSPDGKRLGIVANGTRNDCGLAFDSRWNLFGNDNDHEALPAQYVPGRLLHITPYAYFSWPRGWMQEKQPWRSDLLETMTPDLGRYVPVGMTYYGDTLLHAKYRNALLVPEWGSRKIAFYPLHAEGGTFKTSEQILLEGENDARPVSVATGRGGRLFAAICYMAHNEESPIYRSDLVMITPKDDPADAPFSAIDLTAAASAQLLSELNSPDWTRRSAAQLELTRRDLKADQLPSELLATIEPSSPAAPHLIWLAARETASDTAQARLRSLLQHSDSGIRALAAQALARFASAKSNDWIPRALTDSDPQVQLSALTALFKHTSKLPFESIIRIGSIEDPRRRQTAALLLARRATASQIQNLCNSPEQANRRLGILAAGFRLTVPDWEHPLDPSIPLDAGNKKAYRVTYAGDIVQDLTTLGHIGNFTMADAWAKRTRTAEDDTLFASLQTALQESDVNLRKQAAFFLNLLADQRVQKEVDAILGRPAVGENKAPIANATAASATELPEAFRKVDWTAEVAHGDLKRGRELFMTRGCAVCHSIKDGESGGGGPSLAGAGTRFTIPYVIESVMIPNKVVAPLFRWTSAKLKSGEVLNGLVTSETASEVEFLFPAGIKRTVKKAEIESREIQDRSPMPEGLIQTPEELRDLVAFLLAPPHQQEATATK